MDDRSFDALAKAVSAPGSRRRLIAGLLSGAMGLAGRRPAAAAVCRTFGQTCRENANCCSRVCGPRDATGRRRCGCGSADECPSGQTCALGACCTPLSVCKGAGGVALCGDVSDGCEGIVHCPAECPTIGDVCTDDHTCCTPAKCAEGACGPTDDGCGRTVNCGDCGACQVCTGGFCVPDQTAEGHPCATAGEFGALCCGGQCADLPDDRDRLCCGTSTCIAG